MPEISQAKGKNGFDLVILFGFIIVIGVVGRGYDFISQSGYIPHTMTANIRFKGEWLEGENRECGGVEDRTVGKKREISGLNCPVDIGTEGESHNVTVKFFGRTARRDVGFYDELYALKYQWRCHRESDSFTCYALN